MSIELIQGGKTLGSVKQKTIDKLGQELSVLKRKTGLSLDAYGTYVLHIDSVRLLHNALTARTESDVVELRKLLSRALQQNESVVFEGD